MPTRAVVFIPGVGREPFGDSSMLDGLGDRLGAALDRSSADGISVENEEETIELGDPFGKTECLRISSITSGQKATVAEIFALDLPALLTEPYDEMGTKTRALKIAKLLPALIWRIATVLREKPKKLAEQIQVAIGAFIVVALLVAFLGMLIVIFGAILEPITGLGFLDFARAWIVALAALITLGLANMPPKLRKELNSNLTVSIVAGSYVTSGAGKDVAIGKLGSFIDKLGDTGRYDRVDIFSYSFGALIAIDAVFPSTTTIGSMRNVRSLVTIGCPADFIQTFWPKYFEDRLESDSPLDWVNVFEPTDLLASNFLLGDNFHQDLDDYKRSNGHDAQVELSGIKFRDGAVKVPNVNKRYSTHGTQKELGILVTAMKRHRVYWDPGSAVSVSVFDSIVRSLGLRVQGEELPAQQLASQQVDSH